MARISHVVDVSMRQQRRLRTVQVQHGDVRTGTTAGLAPGATV